MNRRTAWILTASVGVVCLGLVLSVAAPFTVADSHADRAPDERFTVGDDDAFVTAGTIVADGDVALAFEGAVSADGGWFQRTVEPNVTAEAYYPGTGSTVYQRRHIFGHDRADRYRRALDDDRQRTLVRSEQHGDRVTVLVTRDATATTQPVSGTASVAVTSLFTAGYERAGTETAGMATYEPRAGWYEGRQPYRIVGATGAVQVDPDTLAVRSANVSWAVTAPAGSVAEYALTTVSSDAPITRRITLEYTPGQADLDRPAWVDDATRD